MKTKLHYLVFIAFFITNIGVSQTLTKDIKGFIYDKESKVLLPGANIVVLNTDPLIGTVSDARGYFILNNINVGRVSIQITYVGYFPVVLNNLVLTTGKDLVVEVGMEEQSIKGEEIIITAKQDKTKAFNSLATLSARTFSVEESEKYAGTLGDVSRMASNFAGVLGTSDATNDIVIRGNSPNGLLWMLEGVDIPNPNHYGQFGATGGPISMLNNNNLANSDFLTGAFPAEYSNALSGVFDLKMRNGNYDNHEFLFQLGLNGFEGGAEGPISREKKSSYIINYRYSMMALMMKIVDLGTGTGVPEYQDLTFKFNFPETKLGKISVFGLGGISNIAFLSSESDTTKKDENYYDMIDWEFDAVNKNYVAILGVTNTYIINESTYSKLNLAYTYQKNINGTDSLSTIDRSPVPYYRQNFIDSDFFASFLLNKKFSAKNNLQFGISAKQINLNLVDSLYDGSLDEFRTTRSHEGQTYLYQPYVQWKIRPTNNLTLNLGIAMPILALNSNYSIEPRAGISWALNPKHKISLAYGLHSQFPYLASYFQQVRMDDGSYITPNKGLDFTKSHHFILGYDWNMWENTRLKAEVYYQDIFNVPIQSDTASSFSMMNNGTFYGSLSDYMINDGTGYNYGLEMTLEQFTTNGLYYLLTASLYESKYKGSDGIERNTAFNGNYIVNALIGKEWSIGKIQSRKILAVNAKLISAGGTRFTPVDVGASREQNQTIYDDNLAFSQQLDDFFRFDFRISYRKNGKKVAQEYALDIKNLTNRKNPLMVRYNIKTEETVIIYQQSFFPMLTYKLLF